MMEQEMLQTVEEYNFIDECLQLFIDFCQESNSKCNRIIEPNMSPQLLERRTELEVRAEKNQNIILSPLSPFEKLSPTPELITAVADVITNLTMLKNCPNQMWNEKGFFRLMFRCLFWSSESISEVWNVRGSVCRSLYAAASHKCVRATLAATKDCFYNLIMTLAPLNEGDEAKGYVFSSTQAMLLAGALLSERAASDTLWAALRDTRSAAIFETLLRALGGDDADMRSAALYCLTQLAQSIARKDKEKENLYTELLDNIKSSKEIHTDILSAGDCTRVADCQPEYMIEELCKLLMGLYKEQLEKKNFLEMQDEAWSSVCSCASSVLAASVRARMYALHRHLPRLLVVTLHAFRDKLSLQGKPVEVIRNANSEPILQNLYWLLVLINSSMLDCQPCKDSFADDNLCAALNKLWPWCMMTEPLRDALIQLLLAFTNDCPKAWSNVCVCVSGRSVASSACAWAAREAGRARAAPALPSLLRLLAHCAPHQHCRAVIIKSDVLSCVTKSRARSTNACVTEAWLKLCEVLSRHADGAAAVLGLVASAGGAGGIPPRLLPALANAAHHQRLTFLQSPELLELLSGSLLAGDTGEVVSAGRAVWALAANNHRAKLVLRSAGITAAVQSTMQRLQKSTDAAARRALSLLTYTHTVLLTT